MAYTGRFGQSDDYRREYQTGDCLCHQDRQEDKLSGAMTLRELILSVDVEEYTNSFL